MHTCTRAQTLTYREEQGEELVVQVSPNPLQAENLQQEEPKAPAPAATMTEAPISSNVASRSALSVISLASTQVCLWVCVQAYTTHTHTHTLPCAHARARVCVCVRTHTRMYARTHVS